MKILYIKNNSIISKDIEKAFLHWNCSLIYHLAPPKDEKEKPEYLSSFLSIVKTQEPAFIFSLGFFPFVSLVCGVLGIPYIAWLTEGYHPDYYSPTIRNEWNCIFVADSALYRDLRELGIKNLFFLPLAAPDLDMELDIHEPEKYAADVSMIGTIITRDEFMYNPLSLSSPLKDATKGYLEGCIACQYQFHGMHMMCSNLPPYIWEDLVSTYPIEIENTLLTAQKYYEYTFFNPLITYAERELHLSCYKEKRYEKINLFSRNKDYTLENINNLGWADYYKTLPLIARQSKINLVISHRNDRAMIPAAAWIVMGAGGFLLSNVQEDYRILDISPVTYSDVAKMLSLSAYYYHHEDERKDIAEKIQEKVIEKHTYIHRVKEMISIIS